MEIVSRTWLIAADIRIGAGMEKVCAKFGQPNCRSGSEGFDKNILDYVIKDNTGMVKFYFRNNKLVKVEIAETLC